MNGVHLGGVGSDNRSRWNGNKTINLTRKEEMMCKEGRDDYKFKRGRTKRRERGRIMVIEATEIVKKEKLKQ